MKNTLILKISGMDCSSCVMNIDGALEDIDGVEEARTNFAKEVTTIIINEKKVSEQHVISIIQSIGYEATIIDLRG